MTTINKTSKFVVIAQYNCKHPHLSNVVSQHKTRDAAEKAAKKLGLHDAAIFDAADIQA